MEPYVQQYIHFKIDINMDMCVCVCVPAHTDASIFKQVDLYGKPVNVLNISIKYFYPKLVWQKTY